jgi:hypothetical protein
MIRFERKYIEEPNTGCWLWSACGTKAGYGLFGYEGKLQLAHRVSYKLHKGFIPEGMVVRHTCDTPSCVNPDHLELGTQGENIRESVRKGRHSSLHMTQRGPRKS